MPDTNQPFWEEFKAMFADPLQRKKLVAYFDKCVKEHTKEIHPTRVAVFCYALDWVKDFDPSGENVIVSAGGCALSLNPVGELCHREAFDAYVMAWPLEWITPQSIYDACFYLKAQNVPEMTYNDVKKMFDQYVQSAEV